MPRSWRSRSTRSASPCATTSHRKAWRWRDWGWWRQGRVIFNLFEQPPRDALLPAAKATGTAIIARVPLDSGSLVGQWTADSYAGFEPGSQPYQMFRGDRFAETLARVAALKAALSRLYDDLAEAAMRYVLAHSAVSVLIPGMKTPEEVDMNIRYCDGTVFPPDLIARLPAHAWVRNFYR